MCIRLTVCRTFISTQAGGGVIFYCRNKSDNTCGACKCHEALNKKNTRTTSVDFLSFWPLFFVAENIDLFRFHTGIR